MNIRAVVTDLDRTLLRTDKSISDYSVSVFERCRQKGIKLIVATARPKRAVRIFFERIQFDGVIYNNGGSVQIGTADLHKACIDHNLVLEILSGLKRRDSSYKLSVEQDDNLYSNFEVPLEWNIIKPYVTDFSDLPEIPADKILVNISSMEEVNEIAKGLPRELYIELADSKLGLIMHKNATKLNGVKVLAKEWGISLSEMVAFGDDYNDIQMLKECGQGVAVANAIDEVKAAADFICRSNDEDGVARFLEDLF